MKRSIVFVFSFLLTQLAFAQIKVIKIASLEALMKKREGPVQVINFWTTWCGPCVKELPLFEQANATLTNTKVTLINLDFVEKLDKVDAFVTRKSIKSEVLLLDEIDYNAWIDKVDKDWAGTIPATLVYNPINGRRSFTQHELKEGDLEKLIQSVQ
jgi:thiol-disulfide isomerase/thioredoxin